jgi:hypothetical protein
VDDIAVWRNLPEQDTHVYRLKEFSNTARRGGGHKNPTRAKEGPGRQDGEQRAPATHLAGSKFGY